MNVLVIGRGGREHAICQKLSESPRLTKLYCAPGNSGIGEAAELVDINEMNQNSLLQFAKEKNIGLTIVGPENPLMAGIVDAFEAEGLSIFGPRKAAAVIEGSKSFAKDLMKKYQIPTAAYGTFENYEEAKSFLQQMGAPIVLKADGLAAGKGVVVAQTMEEALAALKDMMIDERYGDASAKVVIEEFLDGEEFSYMAFVNGEKVYPMAIAQDHKRAFDDDQGPNTGGMGAYSPVPHIPKAAVENALQEILKPAARAMVQEGKSFCGILYAGLIRTADGPKVIEFNARFGDPETQVVLPRLDSDLIEVILAVLKGADFDLQWSNEAAVGVVFASQGYPGDYSKNKELPDLNEISKECMVYHAGTKQREGKLVSDGGRVLLVASKGQTIDQAVHQVYGEMKKLHSPHFFYRTDIGKKAIERAVL
ncbi:phosphoribosylamine--glycine ligase [Falsibacillus pallidus]|uniref:Phosphoribosylamine--glycine ligase n=1 Tax=Falsibacillus pallidus TaxID=493781 RepID=A0A370G255_9BACI|nr:phosphoribosylamine--glycine ligase [Falsibacillus pallidus]RDI36694.1 phosphoribosylamine--glycine ligase [Falsibacillus pallidus]